MPVCHPNSAWRSRNKIFLVFEDPRSCIAIAIASAAGPKPTQTMSYWELSGLALEGASMPDDVWIDSMRRFVRAKKKKEE